METLSKQELRRRIREAGRSVGKARREAASASIVRQVEALDTFAAARTVLLYWPLPDEADVRPLAGRWLGRKRIVLPVVAGDELELREYTGPASLRPGAFGILEPAGTLFTDLDAIDLAVVPGVGFDAAGNRLGRGRGYYDRLLPRLRAYKVGVCLGHQLCEAVACEPHDVCMDRVISAGGQE